MKNKIDTFDTLKENIDAWVKHINSQYSELAYLSSFIGENIDNTEHNYELIYELKDEIEFLKQEINALKLIQIISLHKQKEDRKNDIIKMSSLSSTG